LCRDALSPTSNSGTLCFSKDIRLSMRSSRHFNWNDQKYKPINIHLNFEGTYYFILYTLYTSQEVVFINVLFSNELQCNTFSFLQSNEETTGTLTIFKWF
jgi:hypothetical protein